MNILEYFKLSCEERNLVSEHKFSFYRLFIIYVTVISALVSPSYFISDCLIFGRFANETVAPRFFILIILLLYAVVIYYYKDYQFISLASHLVCHSIMWCTIGAIVYLPDKSHCSEGFIIFEMVMLIVGIGTRLELSIFSQMMVIGNIIISNLFIHYDNFGILMSLGIPVCFGCILIHIILNYTYYTKYKADVKLENLSYRDQLTNTYNRYKFNQFTETTKYSKSGMSFIIGDIDFFKKVNDTYGHDSGDEVLKYVANTFTKNIDNSNLVVRWGGEEFLIVLTNTNESTAYMIADSLRKMISIGNNNVTPITMSFGVATFDSSYKQSIKNADEALYQAKNSGRNRVIKFSALKIKEKLEVIS